MLSLTHIFLYNWHRFKDVLIEVQDSLYLAGHNGSGKSSILDAIQVVLIGDRRMRFNSSAQDRTDRNLDSYVRGKVGEHWLRPGNTVAYIALEFTDTDNQLNHITLGVCIEASNDKSPERTYFTFDGPLAKTLFLCEEQGKQRPLTRRELKQAFRNNRKARIFDQIGEYQEHMRNRLGGLNERFFDLFLRALTFQPMRDIREFVSRWLLEERNLQIDTFQQNVDRLRQLEQETKVVSEKLAMLKEILDLQQEVRRLNKLSDEYTILIALLRFEQAKRQYALLEKDITNTDKQIAATQTEHDMVVATHKGTQDAFFNAKLQLHQSDVVRRREELQQQIQAASSQVQDIKKRRKELWYELKRELDTLVPLQKIQTDYLPSNEQETLCSLIDLLASYQQDQPFPDTLPSLLDRAIETLDTALERIRKPNYELQQTYDHLCVQQQELKGKLRKLKEGKRIYPQEVERVRNVLARTILEPPRLLCELLEIPDERWQAAIEAMLGKRRFNILVPPEWFDHALRELNRLRISEKIYDVGLIDLERAKREGRTAKLGSLAEQVESSPDLQGYINTVLGSIICCENMQDLRQYRRAITSDMMYYNEWTVQSLNPKSYEPYVIGKRGIQSQIESYTAELNMVNAEIQRVAKEKRDIKTLFDILDRGRTLSKLRQRFDMPLDERSLQEQIVGWQHDLNALDLSGVAELEREVRRLEELLHHVEQDKQRLEKDMFSLQQEQQRLQREKRDTEQKTIEYAQQVEEKRLQFPDAIDGSQRLLAERLSSPNIHDVIHRAEITRERFKTETANNKVKLTERATQYNTRHQFAAFASDPEERKYEAEYRRLDETELPRYQTQIQQAKHEAEEELREHVLHRLREYILHAREELDCINVALKSVTFHHERYLFRSSPADDLREYYDLILEAQTLGSGSLFESEFYAKHQATFDRFYELLTRHPETDAIAKEQKRLTDYRSYLDYDIEVKHRDGTTERLSKTMGQRSGGETQTPFYVTIAASFAQLYHINSRHTRPTIRLVPFDEAFSKMDQDRIGATLQLLQHFGLQIITATPLERCEYLVPHICTSLVLTSVRDTVLIEPYRNYTAKLEKLAQSTQKNEQNSKERIP